MAKLVYLDTHAIAWLYANELEKFSMDTLLLIEENQIVISPMVLLELTYLYEIGRLQDSGQTIVDVLQKTIDLKICDLTHLQVIQAALEVTWTRDPFDRIIVAQASVHQSTLVTKDKLIHKHYLQSIW